MGSKKPITMSEMRCREDGNRLPCERHGNGFAVDPDELPADRNGDPIFFPTLPVITPVAVDLSPDRVRRLGLVYQAGVHHRTGDCFLAAVWSSDSREVGLDDPRVHQGEAVTSQVRNLLYAVSQLCSDCAKAVEDDPLDYTSEPEFQRMGM